jgi:protein required for attachment to host cells
LNDINSKEILQNKVRDKGKHPPEGASHSHHYHDPHTPWRDVEKINFSQAIIDVLEKNIERLSEVVLIAPPEFLGLLRKKLQKTLKGIKKHFIEKNLVKQRPENILPYLSPLVAHKKESSG